MNIDRLIINLYEKSRKIKISKNIDMESTVIMDDGLYPK